eukprot:3399843-Rhodomonas_salina.1
MSGTQNAMSGGRDGGSENSERVGMKGQGRLPNLKTGVFVDGKLNDPVASPYRATCLLRHVRF